MADIGELIRLLTELDNALGKCVRCGMCQAVCPLYAETGRETDVARGKIVLVENLGRQILEDPKAVKERLDKCLLCGSCEAECPSGVAAIDIFLKARAIIGGYLGLPPAEKALFRGFLSQPARFDRLLDWMARAQGPFTKKINDTLGSSCARFISPIIGDRHFPRLENSAWHRRAHRRLPDSGGAAIRVAFYPGCLVDRIFSRVADAALTVLHHLGVDVFVSDRLACCGIPALSAGDRQTFEHLVLENIGIYKDAAFDFLVTPCATCTATIRNIWPQMTTGLPDDIHRQVVALSEKTMDINQFMVDVLKVERLEKEGEPDRTVTYHDPCHLRKSLKIVDQPRKVIRASGRYRFAEMRDASRCCGMGGSFSLRHYEISKKIGEQKLARILETGAETVATGCPACMLQITDLLSRAGRSLRVRHPVELFAESLARVPQNQDQP